MAKKSDKGWTFSLTKGLCFNGFMYHETMEGALEELNKLEDERSRLRLEILNLQAVNPKFIPIDDFGDLIELEDFKKSVAQGSFIDYDGYGYLATSKFPSPDVDIKYCKVAIHPSQVKDFVFPEWCTHICWFNR